MSLLRHLKYQHLMKLKMKWILICLGLKGLLRLRNGKKEDWATSLSALLKGKALDVYAFNVEEALNYDMLKAALLKRYELTEEGFKRYKKCRPDSGETFQQFTSRMKSYFTRWIDMSGINKT